MANPYQGDDVDPFSAARDEETGDIKQTKDTSKDTSKEAAEKKPVKFGAAFSAARKAGNKTFEWNGKKYTTEMAGEKTKAAPKKKLPGRAAEGQISDIIGAKKGGLMSSASKRGDGCAQRGKTKGRMV